MPAGTTTVRNSVFTLSYLQNYTVQKVETLCICRLHYVLYNAAKRFGQGVKLGASSALKMGANAKNAEKRSPDKCVMPLSYNLEIFPEYLVPKRMMRPQISAS